MAFKGKERLSVFRSDGLLTSINGPDIRFKTGTPGKFSFWKSSGHEVPVLER